jgi:hypothetical protein
VPKFSKKGRLVVFLVQMSAFGPDFGLFCFFRKNLLFFWPLFMALFDLKNVGLLFLEHARESLQNI